MRLLVVEDDPDLARQLSEALGEAGYVVDTAHDGEEGHFLGDTEPYDAVILASNELVCGPLQIDTRGAKASIDGRSLSLTALEYRLLAYLAHHQGRVVSRTELIEHLYDQNFDRDSNTIEVFVGRLRKKLGVDLIHTARGLGYRLSEPEDAD